MVIGRDGTVQFVRVFWGGEAPARFTTALDALLAGEKLYTPDGAALLPEESLEPQKPQRPAATTSEPAHPHSNLPG